MKKRLPLVIISAILVIGVILGSLFDLQISQIIFSNRNPFGIFASATGMIPGYGFISFLSGGLFIIGISQKEKIPLKVILPILGLIGIGISIWLSSKEFFSINGYNMSGALYVVVSLLISLLIMSGFFAIGVLLLKNNKNPKMWIVLLILCAALIMALVPGTTLIKSIFHRPRYRIVEPGYEGVFYHNWWEPCLNYKELCNTHNLLSEEFKSFPSGHATTTMLVPFFLGSLPLFVPKLTKWQMPLFFLGIAYYSLISFTRILVGAHYFSDVCFGGLLTFAFMWMANEIIFRFKLI